MYILNWVEHFNLPCVKKAYIGLVGALAFFGAAISCLFLPQLGDKYGRLTVWGMTMVLHLPLYFMINLSTHIGVGYVACFYIGLGIIGRFACGFILLTETTPKKLQAIVGTIYMTADVLATLYITIFLRYISNNGMTLVWIALALNIIVVIGIYWLVESPSWLVSQGRADEAIEALQYIARVNGAQPLQIAKLKTEKFVSIEPTTQAKAESDMMIDGSQEIDL